MAQPTSTTARLSALEVTVDGMKEDLAGIRTDLQGFAREVRNAMANAEQNRRPNIGWWVASAAFLLTLISSIVVVGLRGPLADIENLQARVEATDSNRFTDKDGASLSEEVHLTRNIYREEIEKVWQRIRSIEDEDFDRPEANELRAEIMAEVRYLRDQLEMHRRDTLEDFRRQLDRSCGDSNTDR